MALPSQTVLRQSGYPRRDQFADAACEGTGIATWPGAMALILAGSVARGEGSFFREGAAWWAAGDLELILVQKDREALPSSAEERRIAMSIERCLRQRGVICPVSLTVAPERYLRALASDMFSYELRETANVIWGDRGILELIPQFAPTQIPLEDAWRTLNNRCMELLDASAGIINGELPMAARYAAAKLYLDMASSLLLFECRYAPSYRERAAKLEALALRGDPQWPFAAAAFAERVMEATAWKLDPSVLCPIETVEDWRQAVAYAEGLWFWEREKLGGFDVGRRLRGWLYVVRARGWARSCAKWPRWAAMALSAPPRNRVYSAGCDLLFALSRVFDGDRVSNRAWLKNLGDRLPVFDSSRVDAEGWRGLAVEIGRNYKDFLTGTRA